jgi:hypothetical protein
MRGSSLAAAALAAAALTAGAAGGASAAGTITKCGHLTTGGFGGPLPAGVPKGAEPHVEALRYKGTVSCATTKTVMQKVESTSVGTKPKSPPGWQCKFKSGIGYYCTKGGNEIGSAVIYTLHGKDVGPKPKAP